MSEPPPVVARSPWFRLIWIIPAAIVLLAIVVVVAKGIRSTDGFASFLATYPGQSRLPIGAPVGFPIWLSWQHGLNAFFMLFILRTGWRLHLAQRPDAFWTRKNDGRIRTKGAPVRIGIDLWLHIVIDTLWVLDGVVYYVLIVATGQWTRIVPVHWDVIPNAISAGVQYASLDWPTETSWTNYNALQLLSYFAVVFLAAPIAVITGIRISPGFAARFRPLDRLFPTRLAKRIHYWTMIFFAVFIVVHVTLVLTTGALNNLNYMYAARNASDWVGFSIFAASIVLMVVVWFGLRPAMIERLAGLGGTVRRMPPRR
jgi:thiosulfate reductase cytochrome b subunit